MASIVWVGGKRLLVAESPVEIIQMIRDVQRRDVDDDPAGNDAAKGFLFLDRSQSTDTPPRQVCVRIDAIDRFERADARYAETTPQ